jgi:hypothetical protein
LFSDPSWQLKALQQHLAGQSPTINTLVQPDSRDISQDHLEWISWWPIGTNAFVYPLLRMGLSIGTAVRVLAAVALILGSVGFGYWVQVFGLPQWLAIALAIGIPWILYATLSLFQYAAEGLVFGICPWLLVGAFRLRSRGWFSAMKVRVAPGIRRAARLRLLAEIFCRLDLPRRARPSGNHCLAGTQATELHRTGDRWRTLFFVVGVLNLLNHAMGAAMNAITEHPPFVLDWRLPFNLIGLMAMAMADADGLARYVLFHPGRSLLPFNYLTLCYLGLPGGLLSYWLLGRRHSNPALLLSPDVLLTLSALFVAVMTIFSARAMEARYIAAIGIALVPAALESAFHVTPKTLRAARPVLLAAGIIYLAIPMAYGGFSVVGKIARTPSSYRTGPSGLYNPLFASTDARTPVAELTADFNPESDIWYLTEAFSALNLPGRAIIQHADFLPVARLNQTFQTSKPLRIHLLLPPWFEQNGKGARIRAEFPRAINWSSRIVPGMNYVEWTATLFSGGN